MDHGVGDIEALLIVAHEPAPARHPAERALDHLASRIHLGAFLTRELAHDADGEVLVGRQARKLATVVGAVSEQVAQPGPAVANGLEDEFGPGRVLNVGRARFDHQQASTRIDRNVALASPGSLGRIVAATARRIRGLDRLAVQRARRGARLTAHGVEIEHESDVMHGLKRHAAHETTEPSIHHLSRTAMHRVAHRIQHLACICLGRLAAPNQRRHQGLDRRSLLVAQFSEVAALLKRKLPCTVRLGPHANDVGTRVAPTQPDHAFLNGLLAEQGHTVQAIFIQLTMAP